MLSDVHCPIVCLLEVLQPQKPQLKDTKPQNPQLKVIQPHVTKESVVTTVNRISRPIWEESSRKIFLDNLNVSAIKNIEQSIDTFNNNQAWGNKAISCINNSIRQVLLCAAKAANLYKPFKPRCTNKQNLPRRI